jgi:hypothetical protein
MRDMQTNMTESIPQLKRGTVWCRRCGRSQKVDAASCLGSGWPKCCGGTMTIDSPDEQKRLRGWYGHA